MYKRIFLGLGLLLSSVLIPTVAEAQQAAATLEVVPSATRLMPGQEFTVDVILKNPASQNIISVRSWLQYDAEALEGLSIDTANSPFGLSAPGENEFSPTEGLTKIGRSNIEGGFSQAETTVATVRFKVKSTVKSSTQIEPYDFQTTELGHTSVNIIDQGFPVNILSTKPLPLSFPLNGAAEASGGPEQQAAPEVQRANFNRPQNLKITTGSGYVDLKWDGVLDPGVKGYNVYYGKTSGEYSRRRSIGLVPEYRLEGLNNNEAYYFAITAFDAQNKESDYSDEVAVIINQPLSSTSPFETATPSVLSEVPTQPQNGPLIGWLGFSALGLGAALSFRRRKHSQS